MQNLIRICRFYFTGIFTLVTACCFGHEASTDNGFFHYQYALVRELPDSFEESLKLNPPSVPINIKLAKQQHEQYVNELEKIVPHVIRLPANPDHPDCNFIEDTALIVGNTAVISRMGAKERRGEEVIVEDTLKKLGLTIIRLKEPSTMDGGDILYTGKHLFVGLSHRTNDHALLNLQNIFRGKAEVIGIPVIKGLHLKSVVSLFDEKTLIVANNPAGNAVRNTINRLTNSGYEFVTVPDDIASNVLRIGSTLLIQDGFPQSEQILEELCEKRNIHMVKLHMSELIKADGALTCGTLLFN